MWGDIGAILDFIELNGGNNIYYKRKADRRAERLLNARLKFKRYDGRNRHYYWLTARSVLAIIGIVETNRDGIRTSQQGLALIGDAEGCRRDPYYCPANVLTVGIGSSAINSKIDIKKNSLMKKLPNVGKPI